MGFEAENLNMVTATLEKVMGQIKMQLECEDYTPVSIIGKSGIGKTESIASLAAELGIGFKEIRLSHYQESDLIGLPYVENGITKHAPTDLLPPSSDQNQGILLLDEVTSSQKSMRSAVYQLMDSRRRLGQYILPERWLIVACGNGPSDGGDFRGIEAAFMSRGFCWRVEPDFNVWKTWALRAGVHPSVVAYLSFMPSDLHRMNLDNPYDMIACPRSWVKLSTQLKNMEKRSSSGIIADDDDLSFSAGGCVGSDVGPSFSAFYRYNKQTISAVDILDGKAEPEQLVDVSEEVLYITAQNIVALLSKEIKQHTDRTAEAGVDNQCLDKVAFLVDWLVRAYRAGVRFDIVCGIITDMSKSLGYAFTQIILCDEFDEKCPSFMKLCEENQSIMTALGSLNA